MNFLAKLKEWFSNLDPEAKKKFVLFSIIGLLIVTGVLGYYATRGGKSKVEESKLTKKEESQELFPEGRKSLEKSALLETQSEIDKLREELLNSKKEIEELRQQANATTEKKSQLEEERRKLEEMKKELEEEKKRLRSAPPVPPPPPPSAQSTPLGAILPGATPTASAFPPESLTPKLTGEIVVVKGENATAKSTVQSPYGQQQALQQNLQQKSTTSVSKVTKNETIKKKYYLPPSFMEATLLSGLDAPAVGEGKGHPVPILLRIKAPAVLPNRVKANLKGCFIIAEGVGNLATERADIRLVSISCIDRKNRAVIDQKIKGFVVDTDGKIGLRGTVVSKMGGLLVRSFLAGLVQGFGTQIFVQSQYTSVSAEGTLQTVKPGEAFKYGLGQGIQSAANELMKFYLELAKQTIPVVEVLPTRSVTLVVSEGAMLEVKEHEL
ncbi:MAG: TraB/VirB10 family protein [Brevinematia bacterium]